MQLDHILEITDLPNTELMEEITTRLTATGATVKVTLIHKQ